MIRRMMVHHILKTMAAYKQRAKENRQWMERLKQEDWDPDPNGIKQYYIGYSRGVMDSCTEHARDMLALADIVRML